MFSQQVYEFNEDEGMGRVCVDKRGETDLTISVTVIAGV